MSATMRVEDFLENAKLFKSPPRLIHVPTRQFPVQIHFSKVTPENYVLAAYKKAVQIHRKLPPGGILIFLTGQQEVRTLVNKLKLSFPKRSNEFAKTKSASEKDNFSKKRRKGRNQKSPQLKTFDLDKIKALPLKSGEHDEEEECLSEDSDEFGIGEGDNELSTEWDVENFNENDEPLHVLPLYSMLSSIEQQKVLIMNVFLFLVCIIIGKCKQ